MMSHADELWKERLMKQQVTYDNQLRELDRAWQKQFASVMSTFHSLVDEHVATIISNMENVTIPTPQ